QAVAASMERTALILVGRSLQAEDFAESRLYAADYDRRYRPLGTEPRFPATDVHGSGAALDTARDTPLNEAPGT
ncbi:MAG: precorrin-4 C(11)-methyltransferase, partial [Comamonadaceae bacterium]